jgi:hypothetical protein
MILRSFASPFAVMVVPLMSPITPERSRIAPSASMIPGFSLPAAPNLTSFMLRPPKTVSAA